MRVPSRCNKRCCQARRNLSKWPESYKRGWPKCHVAGCDGLMYVDHYRLRKGQYDNAPVCTLDCKPYPHRYSDKECRSNEDWVIKCSVKVSKHSPRLPEDSDTAPF